jgi:hypothetical protein
MKVCGLHGRCDAGSITNGGGEEEYRRGDGKGPESVPKYWKKPTKSRKKANKPV